MKKIVGIYINVSLILAVMVYFTLNVYIFLSYLILNIFLYISIVIFVKNINKPRIYLLITSLILICLIILNKYNIKIQNNYRIDLDYVISFLQEDYKSKNSNITHNYKIIENRNQILNDNKVEDFYFYFKENIKKNKYNDQREMLKDYESLVRSGVDNLNVENKNTYLLLGNIYEIGVIIGISEAEKFALKSYNKYCELDLNNPDCYKVMGNFLSLDKTKKKQAIEYLNNALLLSTTTEAKIQIQNKINFIKSKK